LVSLPENIKKLNFVTAAVLNIINYITRILEKQVRHSEAGLCDMMNAGIGYCCFVLLCQEMKGSKTFRHIASGFVLEK
jgi:hypothetical protein